MPSKHIRDNRITAKASRRFYQRHRRRCKECGVSRKHARIIKKKKPNQKLIFIKVIAPTQICIYKKQNQLKMMEFLNALELSVKKIKGNKNGICICFRNSSAITSGACLFLLATLDRLKIEFPNVVYRVIYPPSVPYIGRGNRGVPVVSSVLSQVGFFKLIGVRSPKYRSLSHVDCWKVTSGELVQSEVLGELLSSLPPEVQASRDLYRPALEAMCNCVEHGYHEDFCVLQNKKYKKWWCLSAVIDGFLDVIVCDLGVGIPYTLPRTQSSSMIDRLSKKIGKIFSSDSDYIKASLLVKKTRTQEEFRGKGGQDLKSIVENTPFSTLQVHSNKGSYTYKTSTKALTPKETAYDNKIAMAGTITGWSFKVSNGVSND